MTMSTFMVILVALISAGFFLGSLLQLYRQGKVDLISTPKSEMIALIVPPTPKANGNAEAKKRLAGIKYCAGWSVQEIANHFGVAKSTAHGWLEWNREDRMGCHLE